MKPARHLLAATVRPCLTMAAMLFGAGLLAGSVAGDLPTALRAAGQGLVIGVSGLIAHEAAHLMAAQGLGGREAAQLTSSWRGSSVRTHGLSDAQTVTVALVGPPAGAAVSLGAGMVLGAPAWIGWGFALVHLVNLIPVGGTDGRNAWTSLCRVVVRRWADAEGNEDEGVTGGQ